MKCHLKLLVICLVLFLSIAGCDEESPIGKPASTTIPQAAQTPSMTASPATEEIHESDGPFLLLQTDFHTYQVIDFSLGTITPFSLPDSDEKYNLASSLSPDGTRIILHTSTGEVQIMDLRTGNIIHTYELEPVSDSSRFQLEQAIAAALDTVPGLGYSKEEMQAAVESAYIESIRNIQWYQDEEHLHFISAGSGSSTQLCLGDLLTGEQIQLENLPGLVQSVWVSPDGNYILLKKGFLFEPGAWQDDRYYVLTTSSGEAQLITLPEDVENPSLSWLTSQSIGIIHQTVITGGVNYSLLDILSMETRQVIEDAFTIIRPYSGKLLSLQQHQEDHTTSLSLFDFDGKTLQSITLDNLCTLKTVFNQKIILNCETESLTLDEDLQATAFGDAVFLLAPAPDKHASILVTRSGSVFLLDAALESEQTLTLDGNPLEILWLPDSSGFLYRTLGELYYHNLASGENLLLLTSDLFGDYTNLNAVWIIFK
jgi:WD40 repeat protein